MLSTKQGGIKYHFLSLLYDSTWDWTPVSWAIGVRKMNKLWNIKVTAISVVVGDLGIILKGMEKRTGGSEEESRPPWSQSQQQYLE